MTNNQAVEAALRLIQPVPAVEARAGLRSALRLAIKPSLERVAIRVSRNKMLRDLLRKSLGNVTVTAGVADLSSLLTGTQPLLLDDIAIRGADIRTSTGVKLQMLADRASLDQDRPDAFFYAACEGLNLYTDATGDLTVIANYIETDVSLLKLQLVPMLLEEMVSPWMAKAA